MIWMGGVRRCVNLHVLTPENVVIVWRSRSGRPHAGCRKCAEMAKARCEKRKRVKVVVRREIAVSKEMKVLANWMKARMS